MPDGYILGFDAGTSVVKAAIFDLHGNELNRGARSVPITNPEPHLAEEDMNEVWVAATEAISQALHGRLRPRGRDPRGSAPPARATAAGSSTATASRSAPHMLWTDGRAGEIVDSWNTDGSITRQFDVSGTGPYAGTHRGAAALAAGQPGRAARRRHEPVVQGLDRVQPHWRRVDGPVGRQPVRASTPRNRTYSDQVFEAFGINDKTRATLPKLRNPTEQCGTVTKHAAGVTGLREGTPVFKGQMDITASSLGVGVARPGDCMAVVGTAGIVTLSHE